MARITSIHWCVSPPKSMNIQQEALSSHGQDKLHHHTRDCHDTWQRSRRGFPYERITQSKGESTMATRCFPSLHTWRTRDKEMRSYPLHIRFILSPVSAPHNGSDSFLQERNKPNSKHKTSHDTTTNDDPIFLPSLSSLSRQGENITLDLQTPMRKGKPRVHTASTASSIYGCSRVNPSDFLPVFSYHR